MKYTKKRNSIRERIKLSHINFVRFLFEVFKYKKDKLLIRIFKDGKKINSEEYLTKKNTYFLI